MVGDVSRAIGIDLGTSNTCIATVQDGKPRVIRDGVGDRIFPSVVALSANGEWLVGKAARRPAVTNAQNTIYGAKRLIGREYNSRAVKVHADTVPYEIVPGQRGGALVRLGGTDYTPQEISGRVLAHVKQAASKELDEEIAQAIITVPAYFDDAQRQATCDAAAVAGLEALAIVNEPTAACLAYGLQRRVDKATIAVFDLGGGTFDISIVRIEDGVYEVLATAGDSLLGGEDFDAALLSHLISSFAASTGYDASNDATALQRLREAAEGAKIELSSASTAQINLPFLATGPGGPIHFEHSVSRERFETLIGPTLGRVDGPCQRALSDAGLAVGQIDQVLLVGGSTRVPSVQDRAARIFGQQPVKEVNPDEIVALGAATQCASMSGTGQQVILLDVTPHSLGIKVDDGRMSIVIPRNTSIPVSETRSYKTFENNQTYVEVEVFQGEDELCDNNRDLGAFRLDGLPAKPAGMIKVDVTFNIDTDGILNVEARQTGSATSQALRVESSTALPAAILDELARIETPSRPASMAHVRREYERPGTPEIAPEDWFKSDHLASAALPPPSLPGAAAKAASASAAPAPEQGQVSARALSNSKAKGKPARQRRNRRSTLGSRRFRSENSSSRMKRSTAGHRPSSRRINQVDPVQEEVDNLTSADAFAQLGVHWTDPPARLEDSLENLRVQYGPDSLAATGNPGAAATRLEMAEAAFQVLSTPSDRRKYRREQMQVDVHGAAELLTQQARLDARRHDFLEAEDKLRAALDLEPNNERKRMLKNTLQQAQAAGIRR